MSVFGVSGLPILLALASRLPFGAGVVAPLRRRHLDPESLSEMGSLEHAVRIHMCWNFQANSAYRQVPRVLFRELVGFPLPEGQGRSSKG